MEPTIFEPRLKFNPRLKFFKFGLWSFHLTLWKNHEIQAGLGSLRQVIGFNLSSNVQLGLGRTCGSRSYQPTANMDLNERFFKQIFERFYSWMNIFSERTILVNKWFYWTIFSKKPSKIYGKRTIVLRTNKISIFNDWKKGTKWVVHELWSNEIKKTERAQWVTLNVWYTTVLFKPLPQQKLWNYPSSTDGLIQ